MAKKNPPLPLILLLLLLAIPSSSFRLKKPGGSFGRQVQRRSPMLAHAYLSVRRAMIYLWGKDTFEKIQQSLFQHVSRFGYLYLFIYNLFYLLVFIKKYMEDMQHKEAKFQNMVSQYHSTIRSSISEIQQSPLQNFAQVLKSNTWIIQQRAYSSLQLLTTEVDIIKVIEADEGKHKVHMTGYDSLGKAEIKGVLSVAREGMEIKLVKEYDDYCEYVSSQLWLQWMYEGASGVQFEWEGTWGAIDLEDNPDYSGVWTMRRKYLPLC